MNPFRSLVRGLTVAVWLLGLGGPIAAQTPAVEAGSAGAALRPGSIRTASWSALPPHGGEPDEMELVLSLDGGATYPVRLTSRIPIEALGSEWRVPALPTQNARLALRAGEDERRESEELIAVSEPFAIASTWDAAEEELFLIGGEWRTREALEGAPVRPNPGQLEARSDAVGDLEGDAGEERVDPSPALVGLSPFPSSQCPEAPARHPSSSSPTLSASRLPLPLRL